MSTTNPVAIILFLAFAVAALRTLVSEHLLRRQIAKKNLQIQTLKENAALNAEAFKEVSRDAREAWQEVERLRELNQASEVI